MGLQALDMWPPTPVLSSLSSPVCGVKPAALRVGTAQLCWDELEGRLYQMSNSNAHLSKRRVQTAAYIVDFAEGMGVQMPEPIPEHIEMLNEFNACVRELAHRQSAVGKEHILEAVARPQQLQTLDDFMTRATPSFVQGCGMSGRITAADQLQTLDDFLTCATHSSIQTLEEFLAS